MQNFDASAFLAMPAAKAKVAALALFDAAMIEPAADWRGVAFALHAVVSRKRGKVAAIDDIAMADSADAGEFTEWADYAATGKAANIARGRVTVTFADGWSRTVGMLAGKTAKGRKPWSIAHAVRFAVLCYKLAAARRAVGHDAIMYFERDGNAAGASIALNGLIAAPEIVSVISADSAETVEGDLIWNPCEANAATLDLRSGAVAVPLALAPMPGDIADALKEARHALLIDMGLIYSPMRDHGKEAAARVAALLFPICRDWRLDRRQQWVLLGDSFTDDIHVAGDSTDAQEDDASPIVEPVATPELPPADLETMRAATDIVGWSEVEPPATWEFAARLSAVSYRDRFRLIEDALLAWPALVVVEEAPVEPCQYEAAALADGWHIGPAGKWHNPARNSGATYLQSPKAFRRICEDHGLADFSVPADSDDAAPATDAAPMPQTPARKPPYRYSSLSGRWEPISEAAPALGA